MFGLIFNRLVLLIILSVRPKMLEVKGFISLRGSASGKNVLTIRYMGMEV